MEKVNLSNEKFKDRWNRNDFSFERDPTCEFSWPQRNYKCSFCKKDFKSAQALGGHMNVHRRERAKLRQSPSWDFHNPNPNFLSSTSSSSSAARFLPYTCYSSLSPSLASFSSPSSDCKAQEEKVPLMARSLSTALSPQRGDIRKKMSLGAFHGPGELKGLTQEDGFRVLKKREIVGLDLNMSLLGDATEDLDLELRLGYS